METVEVFKTNVREEHTADEIIEHLRLQFPSCKINFDLEDCDKILRVQGIEFIPDMIISTIRTSGYECEILDG